MEATLTGGNNALASVVYQSNAVDAPYFTLGTRYGTPHPFSATIGRGLDASTGMGTVVAAHRPLPDVAMPFLGGGFLRLANIKQKTFLFIL